MKTVILSDMHNRRVAVEDLFSKIGLMAENGKRNLGFNVIALGDIVSLGYGEVEAEFFEWVMPFVDTALVGNHEYPTVNNSRDVVFGGWGSRDVKCTNLVHDSVNDPDGKWFAAASVGEWLLTHAGLHPDYRRFVIDPVEDVASEIANDINILFDEYRDNDFMMHEAKDLFDAISMSRGGYNRFGGIFWNDAYDLQGSYRGKANQLRQICGHSSYAEKLDGYPRLHDDLYCIDTHGSVNALVTEDDGVSFEFVRSDYDYSYGSGRRVGNFSKVRGDELVVV